MELWRGGESVWGVLGNALRQREQREQPPVESSREQRAESSSRRATSNEQRARAWAKRLHAQQGAGSKAKQCAGRGPCVLQVEARRE